MTGTVKYFDSSKGFGFITPDDGGADVYVHVGSFAGNVTDLHQDDRVSFDVDQGKRLVALNVTFLLNE